jgi:hypothetical protein
VSEPGGLGGAGVDRLLQEIRGALAELRANPPAGANQADPAGAADPADAELRGTGEAAGGQVQVTVTTGGKLAEVRIDPRAMRLGSAALGEQIVAAGNAALDDLRAHAASVPGVADPAALAERLADVQGQSVRQMELLRQGITDALRQIRAATQR